MTRYISAICAVLLLAASAFAERAPTAAEAWQKIGSGALVVDVRTADEFAAGHLDGAVNIPYDRIEERAAELGADKEQQIVLYCGSGRRAGIAKETLASLGFKQVYNAGGYKDLVEGERGATAAATH